MRGFQPQEFAEGGPKKGAKRAAGMVRGPGTGTSDDVPDRVPAGTYIMPADSTQAVGADKLAAMGQEQVPVNWSNGEFKLPPEQVHAVGVQALDAMKNATHKPVVRGFAPQADPVEPRQFFANGGVVEDEQQRLQNQIAMYVQGAQAAAASRPAVGFAPSPAQTMDAPAAAPAARAPAAAPALSSISPSTLYFQDRAQEMKDQYGRGDYAQALGNGVRTAVQGLGMYGVELADKVATPVVNAARGFGSGLVGAEPASAAAPGATGARPPAAPVAAAAPAAPAPTPTDQRLAAGVLACPVAAGDGVPAMPGTPQAQQDAATAGKEVVSGVFQYGRGQYSDNASGMGFAPAFTGQPSAQNVAAADALAARSVAPSAATTPVGFQPAGISAPTVRHSGNDWQARNDLRNAKVSADSITNTRRWGGKGAENNPDALEYQTLLRADLAARGAQPGLDQEAMRQNGGLQREQVQQAGGLQREFVQQTGANQRSARGFEIDRQRVGIEGQRANSEIEARGFQTRAALQQEQLRSVIMNPNATAQEKAQAQASLQALNGKGDSWKAVALQGGTDAQGNKTESILGAVNERTGEMKRMDGQGGLPAMDKNAQAIAIRDNTSLTRDQKIDALRKLGY